MTNLKKLYKKTAKIQGKKNTILHNLILWHNLRYIILSKKQVKIGEKMSEKQALIYRLINRVWQGNFSFINTTCHGNF